MCKICFQRCINNLILNGNIELLQYELYINKNFKYKLLITPKIIGQVVKNKDINMLNYIINNLLGELINLNLYIKEIEKLDNKNKNLLLNNKTIKYN